MPFQPFHAQKWRRGAFLVGQPDAIPDDALRSAVNVRLDRTLGSIEARPGWTQRTSAALGDTVLYLSRLSTSAATYSYTQIRNALSRLNSSWGSPSVISAGVGSSAISDANCPDGDGTLWKYCVNGSVAIKDDGATTTTMGIAPPTGTFASVALATDLTTTIDQMDSAASWTGTSLSAGPTDDTSIYQETPSAVTFTVAASTFGHIARMNSVNVDTLTGGDSLVKDDDYIHLWVRCDQPQRVIYMQIDVDVDSSTAVLADAFKRNYYHIRLGATTTLNQGASTWNKLEIRKARFTRFGTDTARTWANTVAWRIGFLTNAIGSVVIHVDDLKLRGGVGIEGTLEYTLCYKNSSTHARGNPPENADEVVTYTTPIATNRQRINIVTTNVVQGGANHPGDTQIDTIMVWRRGASFSQAVLVDEIADTAASPFLDNFSDATLALGNKALETDNDMPPAGSTRVLFGPGGGGHLFMIVDGYRLYFSKGYERRENRAENWGRNNFAIIGDGSARAVAGLADATQVRVWTTERTYNIVGTGQDTFLPVAIDGSHGCVGQHAVCAGNGALYFVSQDGIYADIGGRQVKLTSTIDPFFQRQTVDGQLGWEPSVTSTVHLAFLNEATGSCLVMVYKDTGGAANSAFLVLKPNLDNGQLTECFFGSSLRTDLSALFFDGTSRELLAGGYDGHVYRIEDPETYRDANTGINIRARTKSFDFGHPQHDKYLGSMVVEGQTTNEVLTATAWYDRGASAEPLGTINTRTEVAQTILQTLTPTSPRHDVALEITGYAIARMAVSRIGFMVEPQPERQHLLDSGIIPFEFIQQLKRLEIDIDLPANATLTVYAGGSAVYTGLLPLTSGRQSIPYPLPAGLRGRLWRVTIFTTVAPYRCYHLSGFFKQLGTDQAYTERVMIQGV